MQNQTTCSFFCFFTRSEVPLLVSMVRLSLEAGYGECHARTVNELLLQEIVVKAINLMIGEKTSYIKQLQQNITDVIKSSSTIATAEIDARLEALQKQLIDKANKKDSYDEIADEILKLREERQQLAVDTSVRDD